MIQTSSTPKTQVTSNPPVEPVQRRTALGLSVVGLVVLTLVFYSYRNIHSFVEAGQSVAHTHEVLTELENVIANLVDAEASRGRYVITGNESYANAYQASRARIGEKLRRVKQLTSDNPIQQRRLVSLEAAVNNRLDILEQSIALRRRTNTAVAQQIDLTTQGQTDMSNIRQKIAEMQDQERSLLQERQTEFGASQRETTSTFAAIATVVFLLLLLVYYTLHRDIKGRVLTQAALRESEERFRQMAENIPDIF